jgi:hypothetical protein
MLKAAKGKPVLWWSWRGKIAIVGLKHLQCTPILNLPMSLDRTPMNLASAITITNLMPNLMMHLTATTLASLGSPVTPDPIAGIMATITGHLQATTTAPSWSALS